jgi:DNA mismatch repair protein MSH3
VLLPSFNRIASTFRPFQLQEHVGMQSPLLNNIVYSLPSLQEPMKDLLGVIDLKLTAEGRKDIMWTDSDKYPRLLELIMVIFTFRASLKVAKGFFFPFISGHPHH